MRRCGSVLLSIAVRGMGRSTMHQLNTHYFSTDQQRPLEECQSRPTYQTFVHMTCSFRYIDESGTINEENNKLN